MFIAESLTPVKLWYSLTSECNISYRADQLSHRSWLSCRTKVGTVHSWVLLFLYLNLYGPFKLLVMVVICLLTV